MHAQIFTYVIDLPSQEAYVAQFTDPFAAPVAAAKGLYSKVWMADFDQKYASFYVWETKADMEAFMTSEIIEQVGQLPFLKNLTITDYPVVEDASRITRGIR
ncbi:YdhR family protein [Pedobacter sp. ISL-68]|uniref:YdhR family protein n=1 Tax=unclassified Pedobacter TaxID=2628915 RepID=UPI001BE7E5C6|nr:MULTISPECIES: YdhR family protein [unclassified Pedobacter]MBT2560225.1 YdhR family protein [Pedobacter sp. ISL-64]MBT2589205.1 YdhR family protein [Pedobacter sp. ISL-68]